MTRIGIVTDSSCDLPTAVAARHGIEVVPLTIRFGDEALKDGHDLTTAQFWERLSGSPHLPETAAPSPGAFLDAFARHPSVDGIVCVCLSSSLSGTYQAAVLAAEEAPVPTTVVDTGVVSLALGLVAVEAAAAAARGDDLETVAAAAAGAAARSNVFAALDTLEYLERGGRVGRMSALLGGLLDVKPLITLQDGVVAPGGRVRTRSKAIAALSHHVAAKRISRLGFIAGGGSDPAVLTSAVAVPEGVEPITAELGPVVGTHTGPGVLGVAYVEG